MADHLQLSPGQLSALCTLGTRRRYRPGDLLFREGEQSDHMVVVLRGAVKIYSTARSGYESVLAVRSAGEIIGEFSAFDRRPRSASVVALSDIDCVLIGGAGFRGYLRSEPDLALALLSALVHRIREADRRRVEFGVYDVTSRISRLLLELAEQHGAPTPGGDERNPGGGDGTTITLALSQQELAGAVGASREAVARSLRILRDHEAITTHRMRITVLRPEVLRGISGACPADEI